jgi:hypothetical protein
MRPDTENGGGDEAVAIISFTRFMGTSFTTLTGYYIPESNCVADLLSFVPADRLHTQ